MMLFCFVFLFAVVNGLVLGVSLVPRTNLLSLDDENTDDLIDFVPLDTNTGGSNYLLGGLPLNTNTDGSNSDLLGGLSLDPDDQSLFTDTGIDDTSSMFAASNTDCSVDSSLLPGGLISRSDSCAATGSGGDNTGGGAAINIDKKVTPFLNLETMELNEICPQSPINPNRIAVCSSPRRKGDTKQWPYAPFHWILTNGELITVDVLLRCLAPKRFIFCCREFNQDFIQPPPMYRTEGVLIKFRSYAKPCYFLDPLDEIIFNNEPDWNLLGQQ